jgi:hypothetical protein
MSHWICGKCGNEVMTGGEERPLPIPWSDGHKCQMIRLDTLKPLDQLRLIKAIEESL